MIIRLTGILGICCVAVVIGIALSAVEVAAAMYSGAGSAAAAPHWRSAGVLFAGTTLAALWRVVRHALSGDVDAALFCVLVYKGSVLLAALALAVAGMFLW